jgi:hypothetical protein
MERHLAPGRSEGSRNKQKKESSHDEE